MSSRSLSQNSSSFPNNQDSLPYRRDVEDDAIDHQPNEGLSSKELLSKGSDHDESYIEPTSNSEEIDIETDDELAFEDLEEDELDIDEDVESDEVDSDEVESNNVYQHKLIQVEATHTVTDKEAGERIDKVAADIFTGHSRAQLQDWLKSGNLKANGKVVKPKHRIKLGDHLSLVATLEQHSGDKPENIKLDIIYEDDSVVVINKPVGMVVHPGAGNWTGTLVNGLLYHYPNQAHLPRAGLVHRIDKNTSGLLVIGKTKAAQLNLQEQLKDKSVYRHYKCVVAGDAPSLTRQRIIDAPIGRHRTQRTKMTVCSVGRSAVTHITTITPLNDNYSLLDVRLETGRTHQIRVHLSHIGHPIIGDDIYGNRKQLRAGLTEEQRQAVVKFPRQALHAYKLGFIHPETGEQLEFTAPLPEDMVALIDVLSNVV